MSDFSNSEKDDYNDNQIVFYFGEEVVGSSREGMIDFIRNKLVAEIEKNLDLAKKYKENKIFIQSLSIFFNKYFSLNEEIMSKKITNLFYEKLKKSIDKFINTNLSRYEYGNNGYIFYINQGSELFGSGKIDSTLNYDRLINVIADAVYLNFNVQMKELLCNDEEQLKGIIKILATEVLEI